MTIYTFTEPDTVTISADTYQRLLRKSFNYDALIRVITQGMDLSGEDNFRLTYDCESNVRTALWMFEPDLVNRKINALKEKKTC